MRFRIYILLAAAFLWFAFATTFMYRFTWDLSDAQHVKDVVIEMGIHHNTKTVPANTYHFKLHSQAQDFSITRKKFSDYDTFVNNIRIGDSLDVYYENTAHPQHKEQWNITHLQKGNLVLINFQKRKTNDLIIALALLSISIFFAIWAYFLDRDRRKKIKAIGQEFYGLGMYDKF